MCLRYNFMDHKIGNVDNKQTINNNANDNLLKVGVTLNNGRYRIVNFLASGGFGNTYVAYDTSFDTYCAIKEFFIKGDSTRDKRSLNVIVSNPEKQQLFNSLKDKFDREARRLYGIRNEHVISVHDRFTENNTSYYAMDLIEGQALGTIMKNNGKPFSEQKVIDIITQMLDALKAVHKENLLHMDVKPDNILVNKQGKYMLIDFGASKQAENLDGNTTSTAMAYTPGFAPTEQTSGTEKRWGPWTDIYALGATAYNLITGKRPPAIDDIMEDGAEAFKYPQNVSQYMKKMIAWMMEPVGKNRPQSADEILESTLFYKIRVLNQPIERNEDEKKFDNNNSNNNASMSEQQNDIEANKIDSENKEKKIKVGNTEIVGKTQKETEIQKNGYTISPVKNNQDIKNAKIIAKEKKQEDKQKLTVEERKQQRKANKGLKATVVILILALLAAIGALILSNIDRYKEDLPEEIQSEKQKSIGDGREKLDEPKKDNDKELERKNNKSYDM